MKVGDPVVVTANSRGPMGGAWRCYSCELHPKWLGHKKTVWLIGPMVATVIEPTLAGWCKILLQDRALWIESRAIVTIEAWERYSSLGRGDAKT